MNRKTKKKKKRPSKAMRYYNLKKNWTRRIQPHLNNPELNSILVRDMNRFTFGRKRTHFTDGMYPEDVAPDDRYLYHRGPIPRFWRYTQKGACHWIVNFALKLAMLAEPSRPWRIISSQDHSTVWDGESTLFDFNFQAIGISPKECFKTTRRGEDYQELAHGEFLKVGLAEHYTWARVRMRMTEAEEKGLLKEDKRAPGQHAFILFGFKPFDLSRLDLQWCEALARRDDNKHFVVRVRASSCFPDTPEAGNIYLARYLRMHPGTGRPFFRAVKRLMPESSTYRVKKLRKAG